MKKIIYIGNKNTFALSLRGTILNLWDRAIFSRENDFEEKVHKIQGALLIIDTTYDIISQVNKWLWNELRLNEEHIGKKRACLPVVVLGMYKDFLETPEGKVFRDFPAHHKYLKKPLNLYRFLDALDNLVPIDPSSLSVIKGDASATLLGALEHDLKSIFIKFDFSGSDEELKERFCRVEIDFDNYKCLQKNKIKVKKLREEVDKLKNETIRIRGNIWG